MQQSIVSIVINLNKGVECVNISFCLISFAYFLYYALYVFNS